MYGSRPTPEVLAAIFIWPLILGHDSQALMTIQCGLCEEDIMAADGWPAPHAFTMSALNSRIFRHIAEKEGDQAHRTVCLDLSHNPKRDEDGRLPCDPFNHCTATEHSCAIDQAHDDHPPTCCDCGGRL